MVNIFPTVYLQLVSILSLSIWLQSLDDPTDDRIVQLEAEIKKMKEEGGGTVVANLQLVRNLAKRPATSNDVLLAAIETLYDSANMASHPDVEIYKMTLQEGL